VGAVAAIAVFLWAHSADLGRPAVLAKAFDPAPVRTYFALRGQGMRCQAQRIGWLNKVAGAPQGCDEAWRLAAYRGQDNIFGKLADRMPDVGTSGGITTRSNGTFTSVTPPEVKLAEVQRARCFQTSPYSVGDAGPHSVTEQPRSDLSLPRYIYLNDEGARSVMEGTPAERDRRLLEYFNTRKVVGWVIHRFFGDPGLQAAAARYAAPEHQAAVARLRERLATPDFAPALNAVEYAELELLAATPLDFISCVARKAQKKKA
jgi:hypothetical protein